MMVADFCAAHPAEELLRPIRAGTIEAVSLLMIDPADLKAAAQFIPRPVLVGIYDRSRCNMRAQEAVSGSLGLEHGRDRIATPLADDATTRRLPDRFWRKRRSRRSAFKFGWLLIVFAGVNAGSVLRASVRPVVRHRVVPSRRFQ